MQLHIHTQTDIKNQIILRTPENYTDECFLSISCSTIELYNLTFGPAGEYCGLIKLSSSSCLYMRNSHIKLHQSSVRIGIGCSCEIRDCLFEGGSVEAIAIHAKAVQVREIEFILSFFLSFFLSFSLSFAPQTPSPTYN
jgi:hypothetical protein